MKRVVNLIWAALLISMASAHAAATPPRIVTLTPGIAEWTAEILGKDQALKELVGVSQYSNYPPELKKIATVAAFPQLDVERIASFKPTLVIASEDANRPEQIEKLRRLKLHVEVMPPQSFGGMAAWIQKLARVLNAPVGGKAAAKKWSDGVAALKRPSGHSPEQIFVQVQGSPIVTIGGTSFLSEALQAVGDHNLFSDLKEPYPKVSREAVLKRNPDRIWIVDESGSAARIRDGWKKFSSLKAVAQGRIEILSADDFARCSLRLLNALKRLH